MAEAGEVTVKVKADTSEFTSELSRLSFWQRPSPTQMAQVILLALITWRIW